MLAAPPAAIASDFVTLQYGTGWAFAIRAAARPTRTRAILSFDIALYMMQVKSWTVSRISAYGIRDFFFLGCGIGDMGCGMWDMGYGIRDTDQASSGVQTPIPNLKSHIPHRESHIAHRESSPSHIASLM